MLNHFLKIWEQLHGSYWFIPSVMAFIAAFFAFLLTNNSIIEKTYFESLSFLYVNKPDGARTVLSTIAGSMITVAGVTFSITIASVAYATNLFGPRLLTNFMHDRGNQLTLGTFIATFLYCLLVLRTITSATTQSLQTADAQFGDVFVPHLAVAVGVLMALLSVGVLIYFFHHVPASIHASNVIADVGRQLLEKIEVTFPNDDESVIADEEYVPVAADKREIDFDRSEQIICSKDGYLQFLDRDRLLNVATEYNGIIVVCCRPGDYLPEGGCLAWFCRHPGATEEADLAAAKEAFLFGDQRTAAQDLNYLSKELIEIAARALSPGVNDPFTAMDCMDWLTSAFCSLAGRVIPEPELKDDREITRVIDRQVNFEEFARYNLSLLRPYAASDRNAALHYVAMIGRVLLQCRTQTQKLLLAECAQLLRKNAAQDLCPTDLDELGERIAVLEHLIAKPDDVDSVLHRETWLAGTS